MKSFGLASFALSFFTSCLPIMAEVPMSFVENHCMECHDEDTAEGEFRVDLLSTDLADPKNHQLWERVLKRIENEEMPPPKKAQPPPAKQSEMLSDLKIAFHEEAKAQRGDRGRVRTRRLNRLEYENTVRDLLKIDTSLQDLLPEDELANGFSNNPDALSISPVHIQQYMAAADRAIQEATVRQVRPETKTYRFTYADQEERWFNTHGHNRLPCDLRDDKLYFFAPTHIEVPAYLTQFRTVTRDAPGRYRIKISTEAIDTPNGEDLIFSVWLAAARKRLELIGHFDAKHQRKTSIEFTRHFERYQSIIIAPYRMGKVRIDAGYSVYLPDKKENIPEGWHYIYNPNPPIPTVGPALVVDPVEITGPIYHSWPPEGHRMLYGNAPLVPVAVAEKTVRIPNSIRHPVQQTVRLGNPITVMRGEEAETEKMLLATFMERAFRRPISTTEFRKYGALISSRLRRGDCFEVAMNTAQRAILCSPQFLFHIEDGPKLSDFELASRLSYFLWRTSPDARLRDLASMGKLSQPAVLRSETERLMASPRFHAFIDDFLDHWLNLREIKATTPDRDLYPEFFVHYGSRAEDGLLFDSMLKETRAFFHDAIQRNLGVEMLVRSPHSFLNERLCEHYGIPRVKGAKLRRVTLPINSVRGGLLTQASVLKVTANGANTSPVIRGVWLLERILGNPAPPPPPEAGSIEPDTRGSTTIREQLARHNADKSCAVCHQKIDPPGFALEAFGPIGIFRDFYRTTETGEPLLDTQVWWGDKYRRVNYLKGPAVDASSVLPDETKISDIRVYKAILAQRPDRLAQNLIRKLITYATSTPPGPGDELAIEAILDRCEADGLGLKSLIHEVVQSEIFTYK